MTPLETGLLFLGVLIGCVVLARVLSAGAFQFRKKEPPAVRVSPELAARLRSELIHEASKRILRPGFQTRNPK